MIINKIDTNGAVKKNRVTNNNQRSDIFNEKEGNVYIIINKILDGKEVWKNRIWNKIQR